MPHIFFRASAFAVMLVVMSTLQGCGDEPGKLMESAKVAMEKRDFNTAIIHIKNVLQKEPGNAQARLWFGQLLLDQGDAADAATELRKALGAGNADEQLFSLLVRALYESGQAKKATDEFAGKNLTSPEGRAALAGALGRAYLAQGDAAMAGTQFELALKDVPDFAPALHGLAVLQLSQHNEAAALGLLEKVLGKQPPMAEAALLKADILAAGGKFDAAIELVAKVRDMKPAQAQAIDAQVRLISLYSRQSKMQEAGAALAALKQLAPKSLQTVYWDARVDLMKKEPAKAREAIAQVLRTSPGHVPALILAGIANMQLGDQVQAQTMLESVVARTGEAPGPRKLLAQSYLASRNADKALDTLKPLLTPENRDSSVMALAGQAYLLAGDAKKSQEYFAKQVAAEPESAMARTRLGVVRLLARDEVLAMEDLEAAAKLDPGSILADTAMVAAHLRTGDIPKAVAAAAELERKQPNNPLVYNIKGGVMLAAKDVPAARKAFERAIELQPANLAATTQLARLDVADKKPEVAKKRFEDIISREPNGVSAYLLLAQLEAETGGSVEAVRKVLERGVAADPTKSQVRLALVQLFLRNGESKAALEQAQQAQVASPDRPEVLRLLGNTQIATNQTQQAVATFLKLHNLEPANPATLVELALVQQRVGDLPAAEQSLRKAMQVRGDFMPAHERLVALLAQDKRVDDALKVARDLIAAKPDVINGYVLEAQALGTGKRWPEAVLSWQKVVQKFKSPQAVLGVHGALSAQNKNDEAKKVMTDWIRTNPNDVVVRGLLADRALAAKDYREAAAQYNAMLAVVPTSPLVLNNLAWALHQLKDPRALERAEAAVKLAPTSAPLLDTLGMILVDGGQTQRGIDALKRAVDLAPTSPQLHLSYARALGKSGDRENARREGTKAAQLAPEGSPLRQDAEQFMKGL